MTFDFSESPGMYCVHRDAKGFDVYRFYEGKIINDWPKGITFKCIYNFEYDYIKGGLHWRLISEKVRKVLVNTKIFGVQFLPINVIDNEAGTKIGDYWALNVFQTSKSIDLSDICNLDIFRLEGESRTVIYISDNVKERLEMAGAIRGMNFVKITNV